MVMLYKFLLAQAGEVDTAQRELDELRANVERKDVELDQALQDRERTSTDLEAQVESIQQELKSVKAERDTLRTFHNSIHNVHLLDLSVASQTELQAQIRALNTSHTSSSTEVDDLKHRMQDMDREKRDLVGVISRLKQETSQREGGQPAHSYSLETYTYCRGGHILAD
jgi:nucleoprotein TPR